MEEKYFCTDDACQYLGLKKKSFYNCLSRREISPVNPSEKPYMFSKSELDRWAAQRDRKKSLRQRYGVTEGKVILPSKIIPLG